jgi:hypothetical protein
MSFGEIGCFNSKSAKQKLVTTSLTHAEMRAVYSLAIDIVLLGAAMRGDRLTAGAACDSKG